jgi:hypothetical protein
MDIEQIIKLAGEAGGKAALAAWDKRWEEQRREQKNTRLWNTRMLLRHYNQLKQYCENAVYDRDSAIKSQTAIEILESLGNCGKDMYIDSIKSSVVKTKTIMAHVDAMLKIYKIYCEESGKPEDIRKYRILYSTYFEKCGMEAICRNEKIDRSTYFRDNRNSTEMLSALIFGADGLSAIRQR